MGRLTAEPELRTTENGISVSSFTLAVERTYQKAGQDRETDFITVVCWKQTAEFVSKYFSKGQMMAVEGSLRSRSFTDKNDNKRTVLEVVADNVFFCGNKAKSDNETVMEE